MDPGGSAQPYPSQNISPCSQPAGVSDTEPILLLSEALNSAIPVLFNDIYFP